MSRDFDKGREYEGLSNTIFFHKFLGFACVILGPIMFFFSVWGFQERLRDLIALLIFGSVSLYLGFSEAKDLKKIRRRNG